MYTDEKEEVIGLAKEILESYFAEGQVEFLISTFAEDSVWLGGETYQRAAGKEAAVKWIRDRREEIIPYHIRRWKKMNYSPGNNGK